jgi:hypothetical protein
MKIVISSKYLASNLSLIDFEKETVQNLVLLSCNLTLNTEHQSITMSVETSGYNCTMNQHDRRWDWVKKLVIKVEEQPIVLEITENILNVVFQY